jgi:hypothetical protein
MAIITAFDLDLSDLPATSERRRFNILGNKGAEFKLEIKDNTTGYYYNFVTNAFQANASSLEGEIPNRSYGGSITFPAVTGGDDQYDVYLYAKPGTEHAIYREKRFGDGSLDINGSTGSSSLMMQKVIYQYAALTLTLQGYSIGSTVAGTMATDTVSINRGKRGTKTAFSMTCTAGTTAAYRILKQPTSNDVLAFIQPVVGSAPIDLPGENIYPAVSDTDTVNGATTTATKIVMDNNVADNLAVGDKITVETTDLTDTVDGTVTSGQKIVMDSNVATKMAVGDRVLGLKNVSDSSWVQVTALDPDGDNAKEFQINLILGGGTEATGGTTLTFQPKCNRQLFTVAALNPDDDNVKEFSYVADDGGGATFGVRDGAILSFSNRMNYSWPITKANLVKEGMIVVPATDITVGTVIGPYRDKVTILENTKDEKVIIKNARPAISTVGKKPTIVKGLITAQDGEVVFDKQQALALAGDTLKLGGYGENEISRVYGWEVKFTDLAIALTPPTTTTTEASAGGSSADIEVNSVEGVINNVSRVGGIGINPKLQNPLITAGGGATGTDDWTMDAVQTLENGITLTVENTSRVATITGNIQIVKAGTADQTLRFDVNKLLSTSAP